MANSTSWRPAWWKDDKHESAWSRIKDALRRDWDQTKKDLHLGGHELNQSLTDTLRQASGEQSIPPIDQANPPKIIGDWDEAELPLGYGVGARHEFGQQHSSWDNELEGKLRSGWEDPGHEGRKNWDDVKGIVKRGWESGG